MLIKSVVLLLVGCLLHELGHFIAFRIYGVKAKFGLSLGWINFGNAQDALVLTPSQNIIVLAGGVVAGSVPLLFHVHELVLLVYVGLCLVDIGLACLFLQTPRVFWGKPTREYLNVLLNEGKNEARGYS